MSDRPETTDDIIREMRDLGAIDAQCGDMIPRSLQALGLRTYADRFEAARKREQADPLAKPNLCRSCKHLLPDGCEICGCGDYVEAAEREHNRQYEPKCNWSIKDALALANTLANHGLRDGNADAASSCIYSFCRILSSHGNAAAMRLCDELIRAAYDADICSPGDLAQRVRKIKDAIGPSQQGNAAALRDALLKARNTLMLYSRDMKPRYQAEVGFMIDDCDAALSAPPRNCDRFRTADEVSAYWGANVHAVPLHGDAYAMRIDGETYPTFLDWLMAPAKEGK